MCDAMEPGLADWGGWIRTSAFSRAYAAPLAYIGGSLGTLIGADLLNLDKLQGLGAPIASIGGAGTFDGVFLTGIVAVLIASLSRQRESADPLPEPHVNKAQ
jgi:uncharacterized membrane protein